MAHFFPGFSEYVDDDFSVSVCLQTSDVCALSLSQRFKYFTEMQWMVLIVSRAHEIF